MEAQVSGHETLLIAIVFAEATLRVKRQCLKHIFQDASPKEADVEALVGAILWQPDEALERMSQEDRIALYAPFYGRLLHGQALARNPNIKPEDMPRIDPNVLRQAARTFVIGKKDLTHLLHKRLGTKATPVHWQLVNLYAPALDALTRAEVLARKYLSQIAETERVSMQNRVRERYGELPWMSVFYKDAATTTDAPMSTHDGDMNILDIMHADVMAEKPTVRLFGTDVAELVALVLALHLFLTRMFRGFDKEANLSRAMRLQGYHAARQILIVYHYVLDSCLGVVLGEWEHPFSKVADDTRLFDAVYAYRGILRMQTQESDAPVETSAQAMVFLEERRTECDHMVELMRLKVQSEK